MKCPFHGCIVVWHSAARTAPTWQLPDVPEFDDLAFAWHVPDGARWRLGRSCTLLTATPIDGEKVDARYTFLVQRDDTGEMSRLGVGMVKDFLKQSGQDIRSGRTRFIARNRNWPTGEGAVMRFRKWAEQSYPVPAIVGR